MNLQGHVIRSKNLIKIKFLGINSGQLIFKCVFFLNYSNLNAYLNTIPIWRVKFLCDPPINDNLILAERSTLFLF